MNKEEKNGTDKKEDSLRQRRNEDYNVPEAKEDVRRIVDTGTELKIEEIRPVENYVRITGKLYFRILYLNVSSDPKPGVLEGKLPFEEMVYAENQEGEEFYVQNVRIEFTPSLIHSRKLSLRAMVELEVGREKLVDEETVTDAEGDVPLYKKMKKVQLLQLDQKRYIQNQRRNYDSGNERKYRADLIYRYQ